MQPPFDEDNPIQPTQAVITFNASLTEAEIQQFEDDYYHKSSPSHFRFEMAVAVISLIVPLLFIPTIQRRFELPSGPIYFVFGICTILYLQHSYKNALTDNAHHLSNTRYNLYRAYRPQILKLRQRAHFMKEMYQPTKSMESWENACKRDVNIEVFFKENLSIAFDSDVTRADLICEISQLPPSIPVRVDGHVYDYASLIVFFDGELQKPAPHNPQLMISLRDAQPFRNYRDILREKYSKPAETRSIVTGASKPEQKPTQDRLSLSRQRLTVLQQTGVPGSASTVDSSDIDLRQRFGGVAR